jgi:hypothetical protein
MNVIRSSQRQEYRSYHFCGTLCFNIPADKDLSEAGWQRLPADFTLRSPSETTWPYPTGRQAVRYNQHREPTYCATEKLSESNRERGFTPSVEGTAPKGMHRERAEWIRRVEFNDHDDLAGTKIAVDTAVQTRCGGTGGPMHRIIQWLGVLIIV